MTTGDIAMLIVLSISALLLIAWLWFLYMLGLGPGR
jgi:hypothetical protein